MNMDYPNLDGTVEYGASLQIVLTFSVKTNRKSSLEKLTLTYSLLKIMHYYCFWRWVTIILCRMILLTFWIGRNCNEQKIIELPTHCCWYGTGVACTWLVLVNPQSGRRTVAISLEDTTCVPAHERTYVQVLPIILNFLRFGTYDHKFKIFFLLLTLCIMWMVSITALSFWICGCTFGSPEVGRRVANMTSGPPAKTR